MPGNTGAYDLDDIEAWRETQRPALSGHEGSPDAESERARLLRIEADFKQAKLRNLLRDTVPVGPVIDLFRRTAHLAKSLMEQIPDELASRLPGGPTPKEAETLRNWLRGRLDAVATQLADDLLDAPELRGDDPADESPESQVHSP
jgi:hypothetical protein